MAPSLYGSHHSSEQIVRQSCLPALSVYSPLKSFRKNFASQQQLNLSIFACESRLEILADY
jgi:hypothetical protein